MHNLPTQLTDSKEIHMGYKEKEVVYVMTGHLNKMSSLLGRQTMEVCRPSIELVGCASVMSLM
jgi:hypothetical protein